jgi:nucleotide-binding universal stress UspA family protein
MEKMKERRGVGMNNSIFRKIMVATDGSELVKKAVDTAIEISKLGQTKLYAVHVIPLGDFYSSMPLSIDAEWIKDMEEHLRIESKEAIAYVENAGRAADVEIESVILEGNPAIEIVDFAEKNDIELIVMGTHGKTGIQRFMIGSVAENVVRHSKNSVLVVKGEPIEKGG